MYIKKRVKIFNFHLHTHTPQQQQQQQSAEEALPPAAIKRLPYHLLLYGAPMKVIGEFHVPCLASELLHNFERMGVDVILYLQSQSC